jgi:putative endopeptidase
MPAGAALKVDDFDPEVRIQDDLFRYVNGRWLANTQIPEDKPVAGAFITLRDEAEKAVRKIITELTPAEPDSEATKIAHLYASLWTRQPPRRLGLHRLLRCWPRSTAFPPSLN